MLMVVLGAGASYDSSPDLAVGMRDEPLRPPLANDLFINRAHYRQFRDRYPQFHEVIPELLPRPGGTIEDALQRLQDEGGRNPRRKPQLLAIRYYLKDLLSFLSANWLSQVGGVTNYAALIGQIQNHRKDDEPVCLVTFNYDTLIESALRAHFGLGFDGIADYISPRPFHLFKLHGSTDWGRPLVSAPGSTFRGTPEEMIQHVERLGISNQVYTETMYRGSPQLYPAIAIPVLTKDSFECPAEHVQQLTDTIPRVSKILTIGWRGTERHFLKLLKGVGPIFLVTVAGTEAEAVEVRERIQAIGIGLRDAVAFGGFTDTIVGRRLDGFLAA